MKTIIILAGILVLIVVVVRLLSVSSKPKDVKSRRSIYDLTITLIDGHKKSMNEFKGKKLLIVNVASRCGFTPQYEELEQLVKEHGEKLEILGVPSNDFLGQEPGSNEEISNFCKETYGVTFWLSEKVPVTGKEQSPLFHWLTEKDLNGWNDGSPRWNFYKYFVDETGELINVFPSTVRPLSNDIVNLLK